MFTDKDHFTEFQYLRLGDDIEGTLCGHNGEAQQSTGLHDKNGKEIYEGDVVSGREGVKIGDVRFGQYKRPPQSKHDRPEWNLGWYVQGKDCEYSLEELEWYIKPTNYAPFRGSYLEIIGNIYSNPELLKS